MESSSLLLLSQGAEAKVYRVESEQKPVILKQRLRKNYRHPDLDHLLTSQRMKEEVKCLSRCQKAGLSVPEVYEVDKDNYKITMEFIDGEVLKNIFYKSDQDVVAIDRISRLIGSYLARMHDANIIHGDLTTSNMILRENEDLVLIDFGLSFYSNSVEDKAVDLYVLERCFSSSHPALLNKLEARCLDEYAKKSQNSAKVLKRLDEVRQRGRKRDMTG